MVKIGVLADTHIEKLKYAIDFIDEIARGPFRDVEMIFHAGDIVDPDILQLFADKPVHAVRGNMDRSAIELPQKKIVSVAGYRFGLIHGWGACAGLERRVIEAFSGEHIDCLVYGHSHFPCCRREKDLLLFNPGSPTDRRESPSHTVGILTIDNTIHGEIIPLD